MSFYKLKGNHVMKRSIITLLLTLILMFAMSTSAFASETSVTAAGKNADTQEVSISVTKNLQLAEGVEVPDASFEFEIISNTPDAPKASIPKAEYTADDIDDALKTEEANGIMTYEIRKDLPINFEAFPHAGVYAYTVSEIAETYNGDGEVTYSPYTYKLRVYAVNKDDGTVCIKSVTAERDNAKQSAILFTNTYKKYTSLTVEKLTVGTNAEKDKEFEFTIRFTPPAASGDKEFIGSIDGNEIRCPAGKDVSFKLHDGQKLKFDNNIPAGTRYMVTEKGVEDGYIPKVTVTENNITVVDREGSDKDDLVSGGENPLGNLAAENENKVVFTNTYKQIPITGIIINNSPFILLIVAAGIGFALPAIFKHRRTTKH